MTTSTPSTRLRRVRWLGAAVASVLVAAGLMSSSAQAATTTSSVIATADTSVNASTPTKPTASSNSMGVYGSPQVIGLVRFVIPAAPAGKTLTGATLRLRTTTITSAGTASAVTVRSSGDAWTESTATWNNRPALGTSVLGTLPAGSQPNTAYAVALNVTAWGKPTGSVSLALQSTGTDSFWLWTREQTTSSYRPTLQLTWSDTAPPADTTAPTAPSALTATPSGSNVNLSWTASTDATGVTGYTVHRSATAGFTPSVATAIGTPTTTTFSDPSRPNGTWYYRVVAKDAANNTSGASNQATAVVDVPPADTTAPTAPSELTATPSGSNVNLSWTASTDATGVTGYTVHRSATAGFTPSVATAIGTPTTTTFSDPSRPNGTWYYRVVAKDAANNTSDPSDEANAVVDVPIDATAPSAPTGLTASASGSTVNLGWTASTDDTGVTGYVVHRSATAGFTPGTTTVVGTPTTTTFSDPSRPNGTWYYRVVAEDAANNTSDPSDEANAVVSTVPQTETQTSTTDTADAYIDSSKPTTLNNASASLGVYGSPQVIGLMRFVIPAAPAGKTLVGASLRVRTTTTASAGSATAMRLTPAGDNWTESTATWNNRPSISSTVVGTLPGGTAADAVYTIPLDLNAWGNPSGSVTLAMQGTSSDSFWLWSRRHANNLYRPTLQLTWAGDEQAPTLDPLDTGATKVVAATGDVVCPPEDTPTNDTTCQHVAVKNLIDTINPDRVIMTGDLAQGIASFEEFTAPGKFKDTFSYLGDRLLPVIGNHEAYTPDAAGYWDYFYGPGVMTGRLGQRPVGWYTAAVGSWRFIGLNSECDAGGLAGGCGVTSAQYQWLKSVLDHDTAQCTVVAYHKPRWTTGSGHPPYVEMAPIWDLLASRGVDLVLNGHNHVAESFKPIGVSGTAAQPTLANPGTRQFTVGIGGDSQANLQATGAGQFSALVARTRGTYGVLKLTLKPGAYDWKFEPVAGKTFTNMGTTGSFSGNDTCH